MKTIPSENPDHKVLHKPDEDPFERESDPKVLHKPMQIIPSNGPAHSRRIMKAEYQTRPPIYREIGSFSNEFSETDD